MPSRRWQLRNARARALGYQNYYDYRIHNFGQIPASEPAPTGQIRRKLRGHASAQDLMRAIPGARSAVISAIGRDEEGRFEHFEAAVHGRDGETRFFSLKGGSASAENLSRIEELLEDEGIDFEIQKS